MFGDIGSRVRVCKMGGKYWKRAVVFAFSIERTLFDFIFMVSIALDRITAICAIISNILVLATHIYFLDKNYTSSKVRTGYSPKQNGNILFFTMYAAILNVIVTILAILFEIVIMIKEQWFTSIKNRFLRGTLYLIIGIVTLGLMNDLGIAAGSIQIMVSVAMIILELIGMFSS